MAELPAGEIPQNPLRYTGYFSNPVSSAPSRPSRSLGTDWPRLIRNCFLGGASLFVVGAGVTVLLSIETEQQSTKAQTQPAANTGESTVSQVVLKNTATPRRVRPAAIPANSEAQYATYTVPKPQPTLAQTQPAANTGEPTVIQVVPRRGAPTPTRVRPAAIPANIEAQHAIYTVPDAQPSTERSTRRLQSFYQPRQPAPAHSQRSDLRATSPRSCPKVPLLPDPDF